MWIPESAQADGHHSLIARILGAAVRSRDATGRLLPSRGMSTLSASASHRAKESGGHRTRLAIHGRMLTLGQYASYVKPPYLSRSV